MKKYNVLSILLILILISFFKFSYPIYDQVYADVDEFKDVDGISYLDNLSYSKNYSLIVTSYDDKRYETLSNLLGPQITPRSHYLHLDDYFDLAYYGGGENINVSVYVRKT